LPVEPIGGPKDRAIVLATPAPLTHRTAEENLGLGYLAATLRAAGHRVVVIDGWLQGLTVTELADATVRCNPVLVGFACYRSNMQRAMETLRLVRSTGQKPFSVAGGYGPTFHADEFLRAGFDAVVRGEGEVPLTKLAQHVEHGSPPLAEIDGLSFRDGGGRIHHSRRPAPKLPMDELPDPHRDTLELTIARRSLVHVQSARGCQASCTFCSIVAFERVGGGSTWRQRSVSRIVDELEQLAGRGVTHVKVIDDSFLEPPRDAHWCAEFADELDRREVRLRMRGSVRADRVSEDAVAALARAGFFSFSCGIENFSESALRRMAKRATVSQNCRALDTFRRHGIYVQAGHILFDDRTTVAELAENHALMCRYDWTISKGVFTEMYAAAGTNFTRRLLKTGELQVDQDVLGNSRYLLQDEYARQLYFGLRRWHKDHAAIYDKAIDPLTAPKALWNHELEMFHQLSTELRTMDLAFFGRLLDEARSARSVQALTQAVDDIHAAESARTDAWYRDFETRVDDAYAQANLIYDAEANPFLC
jgi:anaerobic magnesium-protoporphyrin IX monomethyl ester cyclase